MADNGKYLQVMVLRKDPYYRGGQKLEGVMCFAPGALSQEQERSITGDGSGVIKALYVDTPPDGATIIGAPKTEKAKGK